MKPNFDKQFILSTDASDHALGGMLSQLDKDGEMRLLPFTATNSHQPNRIMMFLIKNF